MLSLTSCAEVFNENSQLCPDVDVPNELRNSSNKEAWPFVRASTSALSSVGSSSAPSQSPPSLPRIPLSESIEEEPTAPGTLLGPADLSDEESSDDGLANQIRLLELDPAPSRFKGKAAATGLLKSVLEARSELMPPKAAAEVEKNTARGADRRRPQYWGPDPVSRRPSLDTC
jgi:hypothetical protein